MKGQHRWSVATFLIGFTLTACSRAAPVRFEGDGCDAQPVSPLEERVYAQIVGELLRSYRVVYVARRTGDRKPPGWWDSEAFFSESPERRHEIVPSRGDPTTPFGQAWNDLYRKMDDGARCIRQIPLDTEPARDAKHGVKVEFTRVGFDSTGTLGLVEVTLTWSRVPTLGGGGSEVRIVHVTPHGITSEIFAQLFS